jgi:hypothetical protein
VSRRGAGQLRRGVARWLVSVSVSLGCTGCFDSLIGSPCLPGYELVAGECVVRGEPPDGGVPDGGDAAPPRDGAVCVAPTVDCFGECRDLRSDPDHCGVCGRRCPSGLCVDSLCTGGLTGHIVAIGHDYQQHHAAMARVLGNAIALAPVLDVGVMRWRGTASEAAASGTSRAISSSMAELARPWHAVPLPTAPTPDALARAQVLVIEAQQGDGAAAAALAASWAGEFSRILERGGVIIVLHGAGGVSHRFAAGAGLYTVAEPIAVVDALARVVNANDAVAQRVVSPYLAETSSVVFPAVDAPVITTAEGEALVFHTLRE